VIALEVSSAAGKDAHGGVPGSIRNLVRALLRLDPATRYHLCYRLSRWRRGDLFRPEAANASVRVLQDPWNGLVLRGDRLLHSMGIWLPRTPRIPKLVTVHDLNAVRNVAWVSERWHERRSGRIRQAIERADHVVTYSAFTAAEVREEYGLPADRVHPVALGVDTEAFRPASPAAIAAARARFGDFVLGIGLVNARKNFARLAEAVARIPELSLVLVGRPSDGAAELAAAIERSGLRPRYTQLQGVAHEELVALLSAARVYAVPSLYEGFGLTVLEAFACGAPVVCSRAASLPEVAGEAALSVDATSTDALEAAIRRVAGDAGLAGELAERGRKRAAELSWDAAATRLRALYREVGGV
jgi:glycosyltransferase involved in cell wall biosynthesis